MPKYGKKKEKKLTKQQLAYFIKNLSLDTTVPTTIHEEILNYQIDWREKAELSLLERDSAEFLKALSHINCTDMRTCLINAYNTLSQSANKKSHLIIEQTYNQDKADETEKVHIIEEENSYKQVKDSKIVYTQHFINRKKRTAIIE